MNWDILLPALAAQLCLVGGQLFMKHAMNQTHGDPIQWRRVVPPFSAGLCALTTWFLLWGGVLQKAQLSYIFPFEGLGPVLVVFGAMLFLQERIAKQAWFGIVLIGLGVALVSVS